MIKYKLPLLFKQFNIKGIAFDSRKVQKGDAFFAVRGYGSDGNQYIEEALSNGAKLVITDSPAHNIMPQLIYVENAAQALAEAAAIFYPKLPRHLISVTGTNGKTSVVTYCRQLYALLGANGASIGTLGVEVSTFHPGSLREEKEIAGNGEKYNILTGGLTTADSLSLRKIFYQLAEDDINYVAFEASSHGLIQERLYGIPVEAAAFTSFSQDHLDYHDTMENYLQVKLKLFRDNLIPQGLAVINTEISELNLIMDCLNSLNCAIVTVGNSGGVKILKLDQTIQGQTINFSYLNKEYEVNTEIIGSFQANNLLIAAVMVSRGGFSFDDIIKHLPYLAPPPSRLERITVKNHPYHIFVDHGHTPDALEKCLTELKRLKDATGKLLVIFGCGGNRDRTKRAVMGRIASSLADIVIITDDNPRDENPADIRAEILAGAEAALEYDDRREAITQVISSLERGDILLIAGKGHEEYQIIGNKKIPLNDIKIVKEVLNDLDSKAARRSVRG